jgi:hypothetical protein
VLLFGPFVCSHRERVELVILMQVVAPKLTALQIQEGRLRSAEVRWGTATCSSRWCCHFMPRRVVSATQMELTKQTEKLALCKQSLDMLQTEFQMKLAEKSRIEASASATRAKMEQVASLHRESCGSRGSCR